MISYLQNNIIRSYTSVIIFMIRWKLCTIIKNKFNLIIDPVHINALLYQYTWHHTMSLNNTPSSSPWRSRCVVQYSTWQSARQQWGSAPHPMLYPQRPPPSTGGPPQCPPQCPALGPPQWGSSCVWGPFVLCPLSSIVGLWLSFNYNQQVKFAHHIYIWRADDSICGGKLHTEMKEIHWEFW